tara:strand:+ start:3155 stop:3967 length:813 start_codon:yes stop_codon:yes gene_type:complete
MYSFYLKLPLALVFLCLSLYFGCGISEAEQEEELVKIPDSPPQITITLRSDFIVEQPLEPDPQINKSADKVLIFGKKKRGTADQKKPALSPFKLDEGYQSIERFERVSPEKFEMGFEKKPKPSKKTIRQNFKLPDKSLILAGRGFNIQTFKASSLASDMDYTLHLREQVQHIPTSGFEDHLDSAGEYSKHTKDLIYGETRAAFGKMPPPFAKSNTVESEVQVQITVEKNPNSVIVLPLGEDSIAVISGDEKSLDLLTGNETLNKKRFRSE